MIDLARIRLAAVLLPAALLLHEGAYALGPGGESSGHGYLEVAIPLLAVVAGSLALGALIGSVLRPLAAERSARGQLSPLIFAAALIAIFVGQELVESLVAGSGLPGLLTALSAAPMLLPLALLGGLLATALAEALGWAGLRLAHLVRGSRRARQAPAAALRYCDAPVFLISPLAFGLASRPPPRRLRG